MKNRTQMILMLRMVADFKNKKLKIRLMKKDHLSWNKIFPFT